MELTQLRKEVAFLKEELLGCRLTKLEKDQISNLYIRNRKCIQNVLIFFFFYIVDSNHQNAISALHTYISGVGHNIIIVMPNNAGNITIGDQFNHN